MKGIVRRMLRPISRPLSRMRCRRGFGVHSPFAFRFINDIINEQRRYGYAAYSAINRIARSSGTSSAMLRRYYRLLVMADTTVMHPGSDRAFQEVTRLYHPSKKASVTNTAQQKKSPAGEVWVISSPDDPMPHIEQCCARRIHTFVVWPDTRSEAISLRLSEAMAKRTSGQVFFIGHAAIMVLTSSLAAKDYRL
ncbi:MAG: hypothetical protein HDS60_01555 [Barnesiella sp.]|nr:hypothetical protein [Barnesiella sp.]